MTEVGHGWFSGLGDNLVQIAQRNMVEGGEPTNTYLNHAVRLAFGQDESAYTALANTCRKTFLEIRGDKVCRDSNDLPLWTYMFFAGALMEAEKTGDLDLERKYSFACGAVWGELEAMWQWRKPAEHGAKRLTNLTESRESHNAIRANQAALEHSRWQSAADEIWERHPSWTKINVATELAKNPLFAGASCHTIRQRIKKPDKAG